MRVILTSFAIILAATAAQGGAWAREKGQLFTASAANLWVSDGSEVEMYYDPTFYAEYGLTDRVTVGVDYFSAGNDLIHTGLIFARFPLGDVTGRDRISAGFGFGARTDLVYDFDYLQRGSVSWGRGLDQGWLAVDLSATYSRNTQIYRPKGDFTWGHNLSDDWTVMFQLQAGEANDDTRYAKISPAFIYRINDQFQLSLGATKTLKGNAADTIRLTLWQTY